MQAKPIQKVWIDPPRYWSATENMSSEERQALLDSIEMLLTSGNEDALRRFDFLSLDDPYLRSRKAC